MEFVFLTQTGGILGPFAWALGKIFEGIYFVCDKVGIESIGLCIILFTIITKLLLLPMSIKQQKSMKINSIITPEIQAIQKKYENRKDQQSQMEMSQEMNAVYQKYGTSAFGGCGQLLIQMPILFALYRVIMNIPAYVGQVKDYYIEIINTLSTSQIKEYFDISVSKVSELTSEQINSIVDSMSGYRVANVQNVNLGELIETIGNPVATEAYNSIREINNFLVYNLSDSPSEMYKTIGALAIVLPIMIGIAQFASTQISMKINNTSTNKQMEDNPMMSSMKMMNYTFPFMTAFLGWTLASGLGLYWIVQSIAALVQSVFINMYFKNLSIDDIVKESQEKAKKKREKRGITENMISNAATVNTKTINSGSINNKDREEKFQKAMEYYNNNKSSDKNSISARANMVKEFNERNKK